MSIIPWLQLIMAIFLIVMGLIRVVKSKDKQQMKKYMTFVILGSFLLGLFIVNMMGLA